MNRQKAFTLVCPHDPHYRVELDPAEVFPDDPGQGTPAMLYGPHGTSATFLCASDTGEIGGTEAIPPVVLDWLASIEERVEAFVLDTIRALETGRA